MRSYRAELLQLWRNYDPLENHYSFHSGTFGKPIGLYRAAICDLLRHVDNLEHYRNNRAMEKMKNHNL